MRFYHVFRWFRTILTQFDMKITHFSKKMKLCIKKGIKCIWRILIWKKKLLKEKKEV